MLRPDLDLLVAAVGHDPAQHLAPEGGQALRVATVQDELFMRQAMTRMVASPLPLVNAASMPRSPSTWPPRQREPDE